MFGGEDMVFMGKDGRECEQFIRAIHKAAYAAGKLRDDAWMADLALTCLSGKALRYYWDLEPEVKRDWSLLCPALLARYTPPDSEEDDTQAEGFSCPPVSSMRQVLAPAGPQGPRLNARVGRIKVIGENSADFGYLGDGQTVWTNGIGAAASATEAIRVSYVPGNRLYEIEIQRNDGRPEALGVHWHDPSPSTSFGSANYAAITAFNYEGLYRSSKMKWAGPGFTRIWNIMADNTLCPHLEEYGSGNPLQFFLYTPEHQRYAIAAAADASTFVTKYGVHGWTLVKLLFEPIVQSPEERSADEA